MRVDQAFTRAGFKIIDARKTDTTFVIMVRLTMGAIYEQRWSAMITQVLLAAEEVASRGQNWGCDISKRFYSRDGAVRWNWRISLSGDLKSAQSVLTNATLDSLRVGVEISEVPLIGQVDTSPRPGSYKGTYTRDDNDRASAAVAAAFISG